jgi:nitrogen-specific signal transduction histidine kinase
VQHQADAGRIELQLAVAPGAAGQAGLAVLEVLDSGPGPSEAVRDRLFEPFVTDKPEGAGLGLFMAQRIVQAHGGRIGWRRENGVTCFFVHIPLCQHDSSHGTPTDRGR